MKGVERRQASAAVSWRLWGLSFQHCPGSGGQPSYYQKFLLSYCLCLWSYQGLPTKRKKAFKGLKVKCVFFPAICVTEVSRAILMLEIAPLFFQYLPLLIMSSYICFPTWLFLFHCRSTLIPWADIRFSWVLPACWCWRPPPICLGFAWGWCFWWCSQQVDSGASLEDALLRLVLCSCACVSV